MKQKATLYTITIANVLVARIAARVAGVSLDSEGSPEMPLTGPRANFDVRLPGRQTCVDARQSPSVRRMAAGPRGVRPQRTDVGPYRCSGLEGHLHSPPAYPR